MPYPVATPANSLPVGSANPAPPYSGTFIPEIWSGKLIEKFYASTVLAAISNTDYDGEISAYGDKVKIRTKPSVTIRKYEAGLNLTVERPSAPLVELLIDKGNYFNTILDDVMKVQSDIDMMSLWSDDAGEQMKIAVDREVLVDLIGDADAKNKGTAAGAISSSIILGATGSPVNITARDATAGEVEVVDYLVRLGQALDEQNIPETGRWVVVPSWFASAIKRSELRDASLTGDGSSILRNGRLGIVDRLTIYVSNLLPVGSVATPIPGLATGEWAIFA